MAENKGVYFLQLKIKNFRCFGEEVILDLSDGSENWSKWTVLLGNNGTGKTSLLQVLSGFEMEEHEPLRDIALNYAPIAQRLFKSERFSFSILSSIESTPIEVSKYGLSTYSSSFNEQYKNLVCYGYGANRFMSLNSLTESKSDNSDTLFNDDAKLINAEEWLLQLDYSASKESDVKTYALQRRDKVKQILIDLLPDVDKIRFTTPTKEKLNSTVEFHTPFGWVTIHQLSLGYKTMVAWMVDLAARLFERYPDSDNPLAEPAIVLIDEIDLHLHPKWQRNIFEYLSNLFPATQFIVSAHSPLVVQSAPKDANIVLLRREGDHVVVDQNIESVNEWRLDQILTSDLFGLESSRGPEVEKQLKRRTELVQKEKLTSDETLELADLDKLAHNLPTADDKLDNEAMKIIRDAAALIQQKK